MRPCRVLAHSWPALFHVMAAANMSGIPTESTNISLPVTRPSRVAPRPVTRPRAMVWTRKNGSCQRKLPVGVGARLLRAVDSLRPGLAAAGLRLGEAALDIGAPIREVVSVMGAVSATGFSGSSSGTVGATVPEDRFVWARRASRRWHRQASQVDPRKRPRWALPRINPKAGC
jgi:hypothetical protein